MVEGLKRRRPQMSQKRVSEILKLVGFLKKVKRCPRIEPRDPER
jgi:hypothetical protein